MRRFRIEPLVVSGIVLAMVVAVAALRWREHPDHPAPSAQHPLSQPVRPVAAAEAASGQAAPQSAQGTATRTVSSSQTQARQASLVQLSRQAEAYSAAQRQSRVAQRQQATQAATQAAAQAAAQGATQAASPISLRLATFNVLGSNHTGRHGDMRRYASGSKRARWASDVIRRSGLDVLGLSEVQRDQLAVFQHDLGDEYDFYPGTAQGNAAIPTNLMWRKSRFALVEGHTVPIRFVGQTRLVPYVKLRDLQSDRDFWVFNAHNAPEGRQRERNRDIAAEVGTLRRLVGTGLPVFFVGDLNEKAHAFCSVTGGAPMHAANGGSAGGRCRPPSHMKIDWIFGDNGHVTFSGYTEDRSSVRRITDHALVMANAQAS